MDGSEYIEYLKTHRLSTTIQIVLGILLIVVVRFKYKRRVDDICISKADAKRLIKKFKPESLVRKEKSNTAGRRTKINFTSLDVFNLAGKYKDELRKTIMEYGIGSCGPRGFYGTMDVHLDLEEKIKEVFHKEDAILYSNYFSCVSSVISCFCKSRNTIYVYKHAQFAIKEGVTLSGSTIVYYESLDDLEFRFLETSTDKYVIAETLSINTGVLIDLERLVNMKNKYKFRIILDEGYTYPLINNLEVNLTYYNEVDIIIGSLSNGFPSNGGFSAGPKFIGDFQRLGGSAYVFSASLPVFLAKAALLMFDEKLDYKTLQEKINLAFSIFNNVISIRNSPILLIKVNNIDDKVIKLMEKGYLVDKTNDCIRMCLRIDSNIDDLKSIANVIN